MSKREIAVLACKILSLYAILYAAQMSSSAFYLIQSLGSELLNAASNPRPTPTPNALQDSLWRIVSGLFPMGLQLIVAFALWLKAEWLAERMVVEYPDEPRLSVANLDVSGLAFASIGLLQVVQTLPYLASAVLAFLWNAVMWTSPIPGQSSFTSTVPNLFRLLLGVGLLVRWAGVTNVMRALQNMGQTPAADVSMAAPRKRTSPLLWVASVIVLALAFAVAINLHRESEISTSRREEEMDKTIETLAQLQAKKALLTRKSVAYQRLNSRRYQSLLRIRQSYARFGAYSRVRRPEVMARIEQELKTLDQQFKKIESDPSATPPPVESPMGRLGYSERARFQIRQTQ